MKTIAFLTIALLALAGCTETPQLAGDVTNGDDTAGPGLEAKCDSDPIGLSVPTEVVTQNATLALTITVDAPALVSLSTGESADVNGTHTFDMALDTGRTTVDVTADNGCITESATSDLVRLAQATVKVTFRADAADGRDDIDETFWFDMSVLHSAPAYDGCDMSHPEYATFHDMLEAWSAHSGIAVAYGDCTEFGVFVTTIDGYDSPGDWCYTMDGAAQEVGISAYEYKDGGVIEFDDCFIVLG